MSAGNALHSNDWGKTGQRSTHDHLYYALPLRAKVADPDVP